MKTVSAFKTVATSVAILVSGLLSPNLSGQVTTNLVEISNAGGRQINIDPDGPNTFPLSTSNIDFIFWSSVDPSATGGRDYMSIDSPSASIIEAFGIQRTAPQDSLWIAGPGGKFNNGGNMPGIGIGTFTPMAPLHVFTGPGSPYASQITGILVQNNSSGAPATDRKLLELQNFGGNFISMSDSSVGTSGSTWQVYTKNDAFWIRKFTGSVNPSMNIRPDGTISYNANGAPTFVVRTNGNIRPFGIYENPSDRNLKENIESVDADQILEKVLKLPISTWNFIADETDRKQIGPMAQDFHAAFGLGDDDKNISLGDKDGVALAAIQGLNQKLIAKEKELQAKDAQFAAALQEKDDLIAELAERLERLESMVIPAGQK